MDTSARHDIDDTNQVRPHVRLCHLIISEALATGLSAVELAAPPGGMPTARGQHDGEWRPLMAFPPPVYGMLVAHLKLMAGMTAEQDGDGTMLVRSGGGDATVGLNVRRNEQGDDELVLRFPTSGSAA